MAKRSQPQIRFNNDDIISLSEEGDDNININNNKYNNKYNNNSNNNSNNKYNNNNNKYNNKELNVDSLELEYSLSMKQCGDLNQLEKRVEILFSDENITKSLKNSLNEILKLNKKILIYIDLLLQSDGIQSNIREYIMDGKLLDAYLNFIKYEKHRNDLMKILNEAKANNKNNLKIIINKYFPKTEQMANEIRDIIRLTLSSANKFERGGIFGDILRVLDIERRLDKLSESNSEVMLERPRNWTALCLKILTDQVENNQTPPTLTYNNNNNNNNSNNEIINILTALKNKNIATNDSYENIVIIRLECVHYHLLCEINEFDIENNKDDCMQYTSILRILENYSIEIDKLYKEMTQTIKYISSRCIDIMRNESQLQPRQHFAHILFIIFVDFSIDKKYSKIPTKISNKNRSHEWKSKFLKLIQKRVEERIEVFQIDDRKNNKNWIARYLEICKMFILDDLIAVRNYLESISVCLKIRDLYNHFVLFYHITISNKLNEIAASELDRREILQLLNWIHYYPTEQVLGYPNLKININELLLDYPLLSEKKIEQLQMQFLDETRVEVSNWMSNAIRNAFDKKTGYYSNNNKNTVEEDTNGCFYTPLPFLIFSIVYDQLSLGKEICDAIIPKLLDLCLDELNKAFVLFEREVSEFRIGNYEDKEHTNEFTFAMVKISNDLDLCLQSLAQLQKSTSPPEKEHEKSGETDNETNELDEGNIMGTEEGEEIKLLYPDESPAGNNNNNNNNSNSSAKSHQSKAVWNLNWSNLNLNTLNLNYSKKKFDKLKNKFNDNINNIIAGKYNFNNNKNNNNNNNNNNNKYCIKSALRNIMMPYGEVSNAIHVSNSSPCLTNNNNNNINNNMYNNNIHNNNNNNKNINDKSETISLVEILNYEDGPDQEEIHLKDITIEERFEDVRERFVTIINNCVGLLNTEICDDLSEFFQQIFSKKWMKNSYTIDTICLTIMDYYTDYKHLRVNNLFELVKLIQLTFIAQYICSIMNRELTCSKYDKRREISECLSRDVKCIRKTFGTIFGEKTHSDADLIMVIPQILENISEILKVKDKSMMSLEIISLMRLYSNVPTDFIFALLDCRDDITGSEARVMCDECVSMMKSIVKTNENHKKIQLFNKLFDICRNNPRKSSLTTQINVMPRLRRRVRLSMA